MHCRFRTSQRDRVQFGFLSAFETKDLSNELAADFFGRFFFVFAAAASAAATATAAAAVRVFWTKKVSLIVF